MIENKLLKLKEDTINIVIDFELTQRHMSFLKHVYIVHFKDLILEEKKLFLENDIMFKSIQMEIKKVGQDKIDELIENAKLQYQKIEETINYEYSQASKIVEKCKLYTIEEMEEADDIMRKYCRLYHPAIKVTNNNFDISFYNNLCSLYRNGNLEGCKTLFEKYKDALQSVDNNIELKEEAYSKTLKNISDLIKKNQNDFPLNKSELLSTEEGITREYGEYRDKIYKLKEINLALHKDFILKFNKDFIISLK